VDPGRVFRISVSLTLSHILQNLPGSLAFAKGRGGLRTVSKVLRSPKAIAPPEQRFGGGENEEGEQLRITPVEPWGSQEEKTVFFFALA